MICFLLIDAWIFSAHKEKTASGHSRSDLMKNKRNKVVTKKKNSAGKQSYKENVRRTEDDVALCAAFLEGFKMRW